ncbi:hypothetical protein Misp01_18660 [Microtetraspora sp. NBRC 13810]|uniref:transposase n=1 Tax=Microtetraspora sp. NBRC 13810 TaxID=3030990 RepID=UPI0024A53FBB|nr:transposase [Microtetraspora sp. NBRC 13810]GLW06736.1 hypothetical protein Misp01_18660 [Microtetraspora sp. NBRC 13810]
MTATSVWIGVDAGKSSHHAAAVDAAGKKLWSVKVGNGQRQIEELIERATATAAKTGGQVRWAVDLVSPVPALEAGFDFSTRSALILVSGYGTPEEIRQAGHEGLAAFLHEGGAWRKGIDGMVTTALAAAGRQTVALPGEATTAILVKKLARQLLGLDREIKDTDKLIAQRFRTHPQAHIIESLPGMGPLLGAQFVVATSGDVRAAFTHAGRLASYAGLAPVPRDSGRITGNNRRPKRYHRPLRQVFYMAALSSIRADGLSRAFYQRKRDENKLHTQALLALARRLVDVLWALLRDNRVFSPVPPQQVTALAA